MRLLGAGPSPGDLLNLQGGEVSTEGVLLATLETLADLRDAGGGRRRGDAGGDTFDDLLWGEDGDSSTGDVLRDLGSKGSAAMMRLNRAIEREPERWSRHMDEAAARCLGCDVSGVPWSMQEYGRQQVWSIVRN